MGVGNWLPSMEHRLFYVDIDSWLDVEEFSKLIKSGEIDSDVGYEAFLQESYDSELEMVVSALESTASVLQRHGIPFESIQYGHRASMNLLERKEWMQPLLECGLVRVAVKEVVPAATAVATPALAPVATTERTPVSPVDQVACWVTSLVELSS